MAVVICLNIITLTLEYYNQPDFYDETFNIINTFFIAIFGLEICLQLYALRQHFFRNMMNVYSLLVTIICLICNNNFKNINKNLVLLFKILALPFELYVQKFLVIPLICYAL